MTRNLSASRQGTWLLVVPWELHFAGGVNQVVINLYHQLARSGTYRPLILIADWEIVAARRRVEDEHLVYLRLRGAPRNLSDIFRWLFRGPRELYRLAKLMHEENVRVVNVHYPGNGTWSFAVLKFAGLFRGRLVLSFHGSDVTQATEARSLRRAAWGFLIRQADAITACSAAFAATVKAAFGEQMSVHVVHNGVIEPTDQKLFPRPQLPGTAGKYFVHIGTYEHKKGQDVLIRAFATLANDYPDYHLVLVGRDDGWKPALLRLCTELGVTDRVTALDAVSHQTAMALCKHAEALVLSSRVEPFGLAVLEAGILGTPVVASKVGGIPEIIVSDDYGLLVEPDDPAALARAVRDVIERNEVARARALRLQRRILEHFTWRKAGEAFESLASSTGRDDSPG